MAKDTEKIYTIPLRDAWKGPCKKRAKKCSYIIREFVKRHMKTENVKIGTELNHDIWKQGIKSPPRKVKVQVVPHEDVVWVELQGVKLELIKKEDKKKVEKTEDKTETTADADAKKDVKPKIKEEKKETKSAEPEKEDAKAEPVKEEAKEETVKVKAKAEKTSKKADPSEKLPPKAKVH